MFFLGGGVPSQIYSNHNESVLFFTLHQILSKSMCLQIGINHSMLVIPSGYIYIYLSNVSCEFQLVIFILGAGGAHVLL